MCGSLDGRSGVLELDPIELIGNCAENCHEFKTEGRSDILLSVDEPRIRKPIAEDLAVVTDYLKSVGCSEIYLFGSVADGTSNEDSDLDIAVRGISAKDFFAVYGEVLSRSSRPVDLIDLDLQAEFGRQILSSPNIRRVA